MTKKDYVDRILLLENEHQDFFGIHGDLREKMLTNCFTVQELKNLYQLKLKALWSFQHGL